MIEIIKEDLINQTDNYDVILVGTNIYGKLTNGFQLDMKMKYPDIHVANLETKYGDINKLGTFITIDSYNKPTICLLYINKGYNFRPDLTPDYLSYDALEKCLYRINIEFKGKNIASTFIGASRFDGNGDKDKILPILEKNSSNINLTLYDYHQESYPEKLLAMTKRIMDAKTEGKITKDTTLYYQLVREAKEFKSKLKKINNLK